MKPTVYIETTVPSFAVETRASGVLPAWRRATERFLEKARNDYHLVSSLLVVVELDAAPEPKRSAALAVLDGVPMLEEHPRFRELVRYYLENRLVPASAAADAGHLAHGTLAEVDFIATWNLKHLANANKFRHIETLNRRQGLPTPLLVTPLTLLGEGIDHV